MKAILYTALAATIALPGVANAQATSSSPEQNPISTALKSSQKRAERNLVGSAESMPAGKYDFKPTPAQMSFGQLMLHVAGRRAEQVHADKLIDTRECAVPPFVTDGDQSLGCRHAIERTPRVRRLDRIDAASPRVERHVPWRLRLGRLAKRKDVRCHTFAEPLEIRFQLGEHIRRQRPPQIRAEQRVIHVLIAERGTGLEEVAHGAPGRKLVQSRAWRGGKAMSCGF